MKWKKEELIYLRENYPTETSIKEMSEYLGRTIKSIRHKAARDGLSKPRPHKKPEGKIARKIKDKRYYDTHKQNIYDRKWKRIQHKKREFKELLGGKCKICEYSKCIAALEFHHKDGKKEGCTTKIIKDFSKQKALKEVKKCILLCANCHRELHHKGV